MYICLVVHRVAATPASSSITADPKIDHPPLALCLDPVLETAFVVGGTGAEPKNRPTHPPGVWTRCWKVGGSGSERRAGGGWV